MRGVDLLAVNEYLAVNAQHPQAAQAFQGIALLQGIVNLIWLIRRLWRRDVELMTRLGDKLAESLLKVLRLVNQTQHHLAQAVEFGR